MELFTAFDRAIASTADVVKATPAGLMSARTPCTAVSYTHLTLPTILLV